MSEVINAKLPKDIAAEKGMVNVQINGQWHEFPKGTKIIEACRMANVEVPHYCYHSKLSSPGSCRMCLVEQGMPPRSAPGQEPSYDETGYQPIQWMPRAIIACANTVAENMGIRTNSPLVEACRHGVMEFLLINHPLDCPICDQAGECKLQEFSLQHGRGSSRFLEMKVKKPKNVPVGPRVRLDDERCILCGRCVRFMKEIAKDPVLGFTQRGTYSRLSVYPGRTLDSNYSLNTVDICPVGALTSNDFRFKMRVWFLKETKSIDVNCGTGCNIKIHTRENTIYRITPRQNDEVNSCWMPDSHRLNIDYVSSSARLLLPLAILSGQKILQPVEWEKALYFVAKQLKACQPEEIAIIASARQTNEELFLIKKLATEVGAKFFDSVPRMGKSDGILISADRNPNTTGARLVAGISAPGSELENIRRGIENGTIKAVLVFGEDLTQEAGFSQAELEKIPFLATCGISENATTRASHIVLPAAAFSEKSGTMVNVAGRLQRLNTATVPPGEALPECGILRQLGKAHFQFGESCPQNPEQVLSQIGEVVPEFASMTWEKVGDLGVQIAQTGQTIPLLAEEAARKADGIIA